MKKSNGAAAVGSTHSNTASKTSFTKFKSVEDKNFKNSQNHFIPLIPQKRLIEMPVRLVFTSDELFSKNELIEYETNMDRFIDTLNFVKTYNKDELTLRTFMFHSTLFELINSNKPFDEYLFTIGMHYAVSLPIIEAKITKYPLVPLCFLINIDKQNFNTYSVTIIDLKEWSKKREGIINTLFDNHKKNYNEKK